MFTNKQIWALLIPLMVEQVLNALMGSVDTMMVSNVGAAAISAVSLVDSVNVLVVLVFSAMATGGSIVCSQYIGGKLEKAATRAGEQLLLTTLFLSLICMSVLIVFRAPLLRLVFGQIEADVMENSMIYLLITALSYPFIAMYNAGAAMSRACGNSKLPMSISMTANVLNVVGNALLIFVFHLGVAGAALATLFSRIFSALAIMYRLRQPKQMIVIRRYLSIRPDWQLIRKIVSIGVPNGIENSMFQFGKLIIQSTVSTLGTVAIAAQAMSTTLEVNASHAASGIGLGMMTIVGQCIGAGRPDEAKKYIRKLSIYGGLTVLFCCILIMVLVRPITVLSGMEPEVAQMTVELTWIICTFKAFGWTASFMPAYGMRAAGDVRYSMIVSVLCMWFGRVAVTVVLIHFFGFGPVAVWYGMFADWIGRGILFGMRYRSGKWMKKSVVKT